PQPAPGQEVVEYNSCGAVSRKAVGEWSRTRRWTAGGRGPGFPEFNVPQRGPLLSLVVSQTRHRPPCKPQPFLISFASCSTVRWQKSLIVCTPAQRLPPCLRQLVRRGKRLGHFSSRESLTTCTLATRPSTWLLPHFVVR